MAESQSTAETTRAEAERLTAKVDTITNRVTQTIGAIGTAVSTAYLFTFGYAIKLLFSDKKNLSGTARKIQKETGIDGHAAISAAQAERLKRSQEKSYIERLKVKGAVEHRPDFLLSGDELMEREAEALVNRAENDWKATHTPLEGVFSKETIDLPSVRFFDEAGNRLPEAEISKMQKAREATLTALREKRSQALHLAEEALEAAEGPSQLHNISNGVKAEKIMGTSIKDMFTSPIRAFKELPIAGKALMVGAVAVATVSGYLYRRKKNKQIDAQMKQEIDKLLDEQFGPRTLEEKPVVGKYTAQLAEAGVPSAHIGRG